MCALNGGLPEKRKWGREKRVRWRETCGSERPRAGARGCACFEGRAEEWRLWGPGACARLGPMGAEIGSFELERVCRAAGWLRGPGRRT